MKKHEQTASHKRLKAESEEQLSCCGRPFTTAQSLNRHYRSAAHRRLTDPEFAKTEAAEKADAKCKRKREKESKAVQYGNALKRQRLYIARKQEERKKELSHFAKVLKDREADFIVGDGTDEDAKKA